MPNHVANFDAGFSALGSFMRYVLPSLRIIAPGDSDDDAFRRIISEVGHWATGASQGFRIWLRRMSATPRSFSSGETSEHVFIAAARAALDDLHIQWQ